MCIVWPSSMARSTKKPRSRLIGRISPTTDVQPVLDAIVESAARVCGIDDVVLRLREGDTLVSRAHFGPIAVAFVERSIDRPHFRWMRDHGTLHVPDVRAQTDFPTFGSIAGFYTYLAVPLQHKEEFIGALTARRMEMRPFTPAQIKLLETFADQAVIAIENVRLFNELKESLEQQTATSEILGVIASSPTDIQPVLNAVAESAVRLCAAEDATIRLVCGNLLQQVAHHGTIPTAGAEQDRPINRQSVMGRAVVNRQLVHIEDLLTLADTEFPGAHVPGRDIRTMLAMPLLREGVAIGVIGLRRIEIRPFTDRQISLLKIFADQAAIAIENVRLFKELQDRNRQLTEALQQQTATSEILRVIASSPTDLQPVFDAIVGSAARLCDATFAALHRFDGQVLTFDAQHGMTEPEIQGPAAGFHYLRREIAVGRAILDRRIAHIHDIQRDPEYRVTEGQMSFRTVLAVPLLREGKAVGALGLWRREVQPFSDKQIALVETFADQAVIAIENVRLFQELESRTRELARSVGELKAFGEVGQAVSSTLDLQTVLSTIVCRRFSSPELMAEPSTSTTKPTRSSPQSHLINGR